MCRARGAPGELGPDLWWTPHRPPPFYGNLVAITRSGRAQQMRRIEELVAQGLDWRWGVKDAHRVLELEPMGFETLFDATWLVRAANRPSPEVRDEALRWTRATRPDELEAWEEAWRQDGSNALPEGEPPIFGAGLLADPDVAFVSIRRRERTEAVCVCNRAAGVVGLSNVFGLGHPDAGHRAACVAAARALFPGLDLVGYEPDVLVEPFLELGFERLAPLRVWIHPPGP